LLPTIEERVIWQAKATIGLSLLRTTTVSITAFLSRDLRTVLLVLLAFVAFKVVVLLYYVARFHGLRWPLLRGRVFLDQLKYAAPFGAAGAFYGLRTQADQWVVAALFPVGLFAAFSIASVLGPLVHLFRVSVIYAFLPGMSRLQAGGDVAGMLRLNNRANVMVGVLVFPILAFAFAFAEDIVTVIYTASYVDAAPAMRVYIVGLCALVVELASLMMLLKQGSFVMRLSLLTLVFSIVLSWSAAHSWGLAGAALGSVAAIYLDLIFCLRRIAQGTKVAITRLQDWRSLGRSLQYAALSALLAWMIVHWSFDNTTAPVRLLAGAMTIGVGYVWLQAVFGVGRSWLATVRDGSRGA
ncbi:MAG TPA: polysaccharide biosynthesis C-terminal domain-containing protein, partial [Burkholderiales bacterium]